MFLHDCQGTSYYTQKTLRCDCCLRRTCPVGRVKQAVSCQCYFILFFPSVLCVLMCFSLANQGRKTRLFSLLEPSLPSGACCLSSQALFDFGFCNPESQKVSIKDLWETWGHNGNQKELAGPWSRKGAVVEGHLKSCVVQGSPSQVLS